MDFKIITSLITGFCLGIIHFYLVEYHEHLLHKAHAERKSGFVHNIFLFSLIRLAVITGILYYILRSTNLHFILVVVTFLITAWALLLGTKVILHGSDGKH
jgi:hypothetical protein